jgi:hypothetical protein
MRRTLSAAAMVVLLFLSGCTGIHGSQFVFGSADDDEAVANLGARLVRVEFDIGTSCSTMQPVLEHYANAGARVLALAGFSGTIPTLRPELRFMPSGSCRPVLPSILLRMV